MAAVLPNVSETQVLTALRTFMLSVVANCEIIRAQVNRVPMPKGDFIVMTPLSNIPLSTNVDTYITGKKNIQRGTQFSVQLDSYGDKAQERATTISILLRDQSGCEGLAVSGLDLQPLYATDPMQMPLITGEEQYLSRWTFQAVLQYNPIIQLDQQAATALAVDLIDVEVEYPVV